MRLIMRRGLIVGIILGSFSNLSFAQSEDSINKIKSTRLDTTTQRVNNKIDSTQYKLNQLLNPNLSTFTRKIDLKKDQSVDSAQAIHELSSTKNKLTQQIDSLKHLNLPTGQYTKKLDSLNKVPTQYIQQVQSKVNELQGKINEPGNNVESKINDKLTLMNKEGGSKANLPGSTNIPGVELTQVWT